MDSAVSLRWNTRSCRSKRPRPPHADEYAAAMSLILLSESGGGFCTNPSGLIIRIKRQKVGSPDTPLPTPIYKVFQCAKKGKAAEDHHIHIYNSAHEALGGHMQKHLDRSKLFTKAADGNSTSCSAAKPIIDLNLLPPPE